MIRPMSAHQRFARNLTTAMLAGEWTSRDLNRQAASLIGRLNRGARRRLVRELIENAPAPYPPSPHWLMDSLLSSEHFFRLSELLQKTKQRPPISLAPPVFTPLPPLSNLGIPRLRTTGDLANWLSIEPAQLDWLADIKRLHARTAIPALQNYSYSFIRKRCGSYRLIEAPKPRLRAAQRRILHEILDHLPPHDNAHGFIRGRSCLTGAQIHAGENVVLVLDLQHFFASVQLSRIHAIFRSLGYPWAVARLLTGLCTVATPASVFSGTPEGQGCDGLTKKQYSTPHLPQGAPTSPALANLAAWHLDQRLAGLARRFSANYSRYADDLAFSGDKTFSARTDIFRKLVEDIAHQEGLALNRSKTRVMHRSDCQKITGVVVNEHINVPRNTYDELKAILHNCAKYGPQEQNRLGISDFRAHLEGRVGWVEAVNPHRGRRLRTLFETIRW